MLLVLVLLSADTPLIFFSAPHLYPAAVMPALRGNPVLLLMSPAM